MREPNPKVVHNEQPPSSQIQAEQEFADEEPEQPQMENVVPKPAELSAEHTMDATKASANARKPKPSELEKAEKIIVKASRLLEAIVEGRIKDNGSAEDKLFAESISRTEGTETVTAHTQESC